MSLLGAGYDSEGEDSAEAPEQKARASNVPFACCFGACSPEFEQNSRDRMESHRRQGSHLQTVATLSDV